jgi:hypothetical protein
MIGRRVVVLLVLTAAAAISTTVATTSASGESSPSTMRVAAIATVEYRAVVIAHKIPAEPPTARVTVEIETRAAGSWTRAAVHALRGVYFWNTVRGQHSVCRLAIETAAGTDRRPRVFVQLLASAALGCGRVASFPLSTG